MLDAARFENADRKLIQIVDAALAVSAQVCGPRLACRAGCCDCCKGPFLITRLDARRLAAGLKELQASDAARAAAVGERARSAARREQGDDEPCPALDPESGRCELYAARPITCRVFGPPMREGDGPVGLCDLCFAGSPEEEIAACAMEIPGSELESGLVAELEAATGLAGETTVALALAGGCG
ncbi:MAG TPA: YkgJ family cysteine cluster protein [Bryobacteraceae bacterium]|nr:YkgJ family cysteine cluster protein [Bryobacteraceae bacterium]